MLALSLTLVAGTLGQVSLGHAGAAAIGAYASALLALELGWPVWARDPAGRRGHGGARHAARLSRVPPARPLRRRSRRSAIGEIVGARDPELGEPDARADRAHRHPAAVAVRRARLDQRRGGLLGRARRARRAGAAATPAAALASRPHLAGDPRRRRGGARLRRRRSTATRRWPSRSAASRAGISGAITAHLYSYINHETFTSQVSILALTMVILGGMGNVAGRRRSAPCC